MGVTSNTQGRRGGSREVVLGVVAPPSDVFDPSEYTVAVVLDYVEDHPEERERIRQAEASGKGRVSLLTALAD